VTAEPGKSLVDAFNKRRDLADSKVCCDYCLRVCITFWNDDKVPEEMETLVKDKGVNSFHIFVGHDNAAGVLSDSELYKVFRKCKELNTVPTVHAENGILIKEKAAEVFSMGITGPEGHLLSHPEEVETEAVYRAIMLASQANCPILVNKVMSRSSADVISASRRAGKVVFGGVLAASLVLDGSQYFDSNWRHAAGHVVCPPFSHDTVAKEHLTDLLANGDLQLTLSDHCTFNSQQKAVGADDFRKIPPGVNGVEDRMSVLWENAVATGKMDACRFVAVTSTMAAKIFNLYPKKGRIAVGSDADIIIWDAKATRTISLETQREKCDFNIFDGQTCHGVPQYIICAGCVVLDEDGLRVTQGVGQFVSSPTGSEFVYSRLWEREKELNKPRKVVREPYSGPTVASSAAKNAEMLQQANGRGGETDRQAGDFHTRPPTRGGGRNMQDSTFSFSGAQIDDTQPQRSTSRVSQPPGGKTTSLW
jgi:D-hydantoinase